MAGEEDQAGTTLYLRAVAAKLSADFPSRRISIVETRNGRRFSAERRRGTEGPYLLIGTALQVRDELRGTA